jgi:alkanesulfonate monooxygenase SsuD/methylene tetrahydromethanopterin reductase-like flavin-dependent oxidoreductase (luciferase family)
VAELIAECRRAAEGAKRDPASVEITVAARADVEEARRLADLGVTRIVVSSPARTLADLDRAFATFADDLVARV